MRFMKDKKTDIHKILIGLFTVSLILLCACTFHQQKILNNDNEGFTKIKSINSGVQRVAKLELENNSDDYLTTHLYYTALEIYPLNSLNGYFSKKMDIEYFATNELASIAVADFASEFMNFIDVLTEFNEVGNREELFWASEVYYESSIKISEVFNNHIKELDVYVYRLNMLLIANVFVIGLLLLKMFYSTLSELKKNNELSKNMKIDMATGLYNRAKCHEILNSTVVLDGSKSKAVIIFDIDNINRINTTMGRKIGTGLILNFAQKLKEATKVFPNEILVTRYTNDKFVAYFPSADEQDLTDYIQEVDFLVNEFNNKGRKTYRLEYAVGYSISSKTTDSSTMHDILHEAEKRMTDNKMYKKLNDRTTFNT